MEIPGEQPVDVIFETTDPLTTCLNGREDHEEQTSGPPDVLV